MTHSHQEIPSPPLIPYKNLGELLLTRVKSSPEKVFLFFPGLEEQIFTFEKMFKEIQERMSVFNFLNLKKGDRINLIIENSPDFIFLYFAGLLKGITIVPINPDLAPQEIQYIINDCKSSTLFYNASFKAKIHEIRKSLIYKPKILSIEEIKTYSSIKAGWIPNLNFDQEAVIIYTSGTTGNPKGVVLTQLNLLADAMAVSTWFKCTEQSRFLCILPLFHNNGQVMTLLNPLYCGGSTVIVQGKASLPSFWALIEKYQINWTSVMPSILSILLSLKNERTDSSMQGIFCGGQILTRSAQNEFEKRFKVPIFEGFGLTETTSFSCFNYYPKEKRLAGSIGCPLPINQMTIRDENDKELQPREIGEICIRGLNVCKGYLGLPEKNKQAFRNDWFHSGDYGYRDETNHFYFKTRKDFLIIKGGENIYPAELENILFKHKAVAECAVIGIPDKLLGEDIAAFVKLHEKAKTSEEELKNFCKGKIAKYKQAKRIFIIDHIPDLTEIPKGPTKKVLYRKLKEYYLRIAN